MKAPSHPHPQTNEYQRIVTPLTTVCIVIDVLLSAI